LTAVTTEVRSVHVLPRNKFQKVVKIRQILHLLEVYLSDSVGVQYKTYTQAVKMCLTGVSCLRLYLLADVGRTILHIDY